MKRSSKPGKSTSAHADDVRATDPIDRLIIEDGLRIKGIQPVSDGSALVLTLTNVSALFAPLDDVPQLAKATTKQWLGYAVIANGTAIGWEKLNVHLSLKGFLTSVVRSEVIRRSTEPSHRPIMLRSRKSIPRKQQKE